VLDVSALVQHELHHVADVAVWNHEETFDHRFANLGNDAHVGRLAGLSTSMCSPLVLMTS
jgi:hypothetical protein